MEQGEVQHFPLVRKALVARVVRTPLGVMTIHHCESRSSKVQAEMGQNLEVEAAAHLMDYLAVPAAQQPASAAR